MVQECISKNYVIKRNGRKEEVYLDKITSRIQKLCYGLNMDFVDPVTITLQVIKRLYSGITTVELDNLAAEIAVSKTTDHPDYALLAARIAITNLHKETKKHFSDVIEDLYTAHKDDPMKAPLISDQHYKIITQHASRLNSCIIYDRDFLYNYFGFKILEKSFLMRIKNKVAERPQHMLMRVAIGIHGEDIDAAIETYNLLSEKYFMHTGTTLGHACSPNAQLISRFAMMMPDDSIEGIYSCLTLAGKISSKAGSVGINIHNIRAKGTYIAGTNGVSNGLIPMLRVFDQFARHALQSGSRRTSDFTIYLEPWHSDVFDFLILSRSSKEEIRSRFLKFALWVPDLFMKRVEADAVWSLMCPHKCQGLSDVWGEEFEKLYEKYESEGNYTQQINARKLWQEITVTQIESGSIYLVYKDTCNRNSNQKHLGTLKGGSASTEVIAYTTPDEIAACPTGSIAVNMFVKPDRKTYDFEHLKKVTKILTRNLNKIIDANTYFLPEVEASCKRHRPIGVGEQGLADAFILMRMPFDSPEAADLNKKIFETIYYGALEASCEIAERHGPYDSYKGSPVSQGILQYDMWNVKPSDLWDWEVLKEKIQKYGLRNSQLVAITPTATSAFILGNQPSVEPYTCNICTKRIHSGEFTIVNEHLLKDLTERDLWDESVKNKIIESNGSIQQIEGIPDDLKEIYKTTWEISQKTVINMAVSRGAFVDQNQAMSLHITKPSYGVLTSMHFYGWSQGLKTGVYQLHIKSVPKSKQFAPSKVVKKEEVVEEKEVETKDEDEKNYEALVCSLRNPEGCEMCGA